MLLLSSSSLPHRPLGLSRGLRPSPRGLLPSQRPSTKTHAVKPPVDKEPLGAAADKPGSAPPTLAAIDPDKVLLFSTVSYLAMAAAGAGLAKYFCDYDVLPRLVPSSSDLAFVPWMVPLLISAGSAFLIEERVPALRQIREAFEKELIPVLRKLSLPGVLLLAAGAGYGEEAFFRGFLQTSIEQQLAASPSLPLPISPTDGAIWGSAIIFGALHALNFYYFIWATLAGALFSYEFIQDGLSAAALTHTFYDFAAFLLILREWGQRPEGGEGKEAKP